MNVSLISTTPNAEKVIMHCARVSSSNPASTDIRLLAYCLKHGHYSVFEMAHMTLEICTSRAISAQILRHKSFSFQEFSQRYAAVTAFETYEARRQDTKNRQNSIADLPPSTVQWFLDAQLASQRLAQEQYDTALGLGMAKECARFLLPMSATSKLYMSGSLRSWIHYIDLRTGPETQLEHRAVAQASKNIFVEQFPLISGAKNWT